MRILVTGGTGLIGRALCRALHADGHQLTVLSRTPDAVRTRCGAEVQACGEMAECWRNQQFDAVINLAGEPIFDRRWSVAQKHRIWASRVRLTRELVQCIEQAAHKPAVLLSGSAIGYYGARGDEVLDEDSGCGHDFGARLCAAWEREAEQAAQCGVRVCLLRTGAVLSRDGGMLQRMLPAFRLGLGARLGDGRQWLSWVHLDDYVAMVKRLLVNPQASGACNMVAPYPVTHAEFTVALARALHRPAPFVAPAWLLRRVLGERVGLLLDSQHVLPAKLERLGYRFAHPELAGALRDLLA